MNKKIYLSPPDVDHKDRESLIKAFDSNWIAPQGPNIDLFEIEMAKYIDIGHACALSSGTAALHLALRVLKIKENDVVLCSSLTFAASANVILYEKAIPMFIDVDLKFWTVDLNLLEKAFKRYKPKIFIAVDIYGQCCDYDSISFLCNKYNVKLIEDAAEALGSEYKKSKAGSFGSIGIVSFNGNKIITTSGGGMLLSDNEKYVKKTRFLSTQSREPFLHYEHNELGFNYRLSNLLAALGRTQLSKIDDFSKKRRNIFNRYSELLSSIPGFNFMLEHEKNKSNRWLTTLTIDGETAGCTAENIIVMLNKNNIESRPVWKPMHLQPLYKQANFINSDNDNSAKLFKNGLCLPSGSNLERKDQDMIIDLIISYVNLSNN